MEFTPLGIEGAYLAKSPVWNDDRGFFREWFKKEELFAATGIDFSVCQANISSNHEGVIRGIHYSLAPEGQAKWVTCVSGSIVDVVVDLRPNSRTYKKIEYIKLSAEDGNAVLIARGLGHGLMSLENNTSVSYLLNTAYVPELEVGILPMDQELNINWKFWLPENKSIALSAKDSNAPTLEQMKKNNKLPN